MSKLYNKYLELKKENYDKLYLFKSGLFYIFLDEDANKISKITTLKCTFFTKEIMKCGFPENCLERYLEIFQALNLDVELIILESAKEKYNTSKIKSIRDLKKIDLNMITPIEALGLLKTIKEEVEQND